MKILAINNTVMYEKDGGLFVYKETGKFFVKLKEAGNDVSVFQISMLSGTNDSFANYNLCEKGLNIENVKRRKYRLVAYFKAFIRSIQLINKVDFVYLFYPGPICKVISLLCILFNKKFGLYVRGEQTINSTLSVYLYSHAEVIFTVSPKFTELIKDFQENTMTIRPMLSFGESDIVTNRLYTKKDVYKILYVGRIVKDKGLFELADALANLKNNGISNFQITIVGDGPDVNDLKRHCDSIALNGFIEFRGSIFDPIVVSNLFQESDIFVLPSYHEGFPRVLYEAMIFGVPIITTFVGSISFLMKDRYNCFEVKPRDINGLSEALFNLIDDYEAHSVIAKNGTKTIIDYLSNKKDSHANQLDKYLKQKWS